MLNSYFIILYLIFRIIQALSSLMMGLLRNTASVILREAIGRPSPTLTGRRPGGKNLKARRTPHWDRFNLKNGDTLKVGFPKRYKRVSYLLFSVNGSTSN